MQIKYSISGATVTGSSEGGPFCFRIKGKGRAELCYVLGTFLMKSDSIVEIGNDSLKLQYGETFFQIQKQGKDFQVVTPSSTTGSFGTKFLVSVSRGGDTSVAVEDGKVWVRDKKGGSRVVLSQGQMVSMTSAGMGNVGTVRMKNGEIISASPGATATVKPSAQTANIGASGRLVNYDLSSDLCLALFPWAERARQRLCEQIEPLGVKLNMEKTKVVNMLDGDTFGFLGFNFRRILNCEKNRYYILLTRRKRRQKRSVGWRRWSNEYLYGVLGLFWDWKIHPLQNVEAYS